MFRDWISIWPISAPFGIPWHQQTQDSYPGFLLLGNQTIIFFQFQTSYKSQPSTKDAQDQMWYFEQASVWAWTHTWHESASYRSLPGGNLSSTGLCSTPGLNENQSIPFLLQQQHQMQRSTVTLLPSNNSATASHWFRRTKQSIISIYFHITLLNGANGWHFLTNGFMLEIAQFAKADGSTHTTRNIEGNDERKADRIWSSKNNPNISTHLD